MEMPILSGPACVRCGDALDSPLIPAEPRSGLCRACRMAPPAFQRAVAYAVYQDRMRGAIHALKYDRMHAAAPRLGRMLAQAIATLAPDAPAEMLVVPVPLHRSKYGERGFNQARLLAAEAMKVLRSTQPDWKLTLAPRTLIRARATDSQANLTPRQRRNNLRGAFVISAPPTVEGKHILLVDDILTSGATARAASLALKRSGAATVWVATLARARRHDAHFKKGKADSIAHGANDQPGTFGKIQSGQPQLIRIHSSVVQPSS